MRDDSPGAVLARQRLGLAELAEKAVGQPDLLAEVEILGGLLLRAEEAEAAKVAAQVVISDQRRQVEALRRQLAGAFTVDPSGSFGGRRQFRYWLADVGPLTRRRVEGELRQFQSSLDAQQSHLTNLERQFEGTMSAAKESFRYFGEQYAALWARFPD